MYVRIAAYAEEVCRWKIMVATPESIAIGVGKAGPLFEKRVRERIRAVAERASFLWRTMYTENLFVKRPVHILAPANGGPSQQVPDFVNGLEPDVLAVVLSLVIQQKMEDGEPIGNICRLRRTCVAFAAHPLFEPFVPRLVLRTAAWLQAHQNGMPGCAKAAFPHTPRGTQPATICARRELGLAFGIEIPGDPRSAALLIHGQGAPMSRGLELSLRVQVVHPDGSAHDVTDRFLQKRTLSPGANRGRFHVDAVGALASTRFQFGLLSSTFDGELRHCYAQQMAVQKEHESELSVGPHSKEVESAIRALYLQRGESLASVRRIRKRNRSIIAPPSIRRRRATPPAARLPTTPRTTFQFVIQSCNTTDQHMPTLRWESEPFRSNAT